jgi:putative membrane protein
VLGSPVVPMLRGLPRPLIQRLLRPLFSSGLIRETGAFLTLPKVAWLAMNAAYVGWHIPKAYEFALASENWHNLEHACFFFTSLMFWWPIIAPWPWRPRSSRSTPAGRPAEDPSRWLLLPYLLGADLVNTAVSALLCFSGRLLYPSYGAIPRLLGLSALNDQIAAGAFMWVMGSTVFLIPAVVITMQLLSPRRQTLTQQTMIAAHR